METHRLKILHIITKGSPFGGAQKYVYTIATSLPEEQFESVVLTGNGEELSKKLQEKNVRVITLPDLARDINMMSELKVFWQLLKILRSEKPDIVHLNSSKIGGIGSLASRIAGIPKIIFTAHGWAFNEKRPFLQIITIRFLSWITILLCHTVIVIAKNEEKDAKAMPFAKHKIKLIYNGIPHIDFQPKEDARKFIQEKSGGKITEDQLLFTWIGTIAELHKNKNQASLVHAMKNIVDNTLLVIIGEGEERKNLEKILTENNLRGKVFLLGKIENAYQYLKAFDIFTLPSVKEGLPYTLLEAGQAKLPCLSTYVGGIQEIIRNNVSGLLVDGTSDAIHTGLEFLISNPEKAQEFADNLHEKVMSDFSLQEMLEETKNVYLA